MTQEIIDGNRFIAEFMGWKFNKERKAYHIPQTLGFPFKGKVEDLKYHTSWDWLMPVVEKIERLGFDFCIMDGAIFIRRQYDYWETYQIIPDKKYAVWLAVVEFIKWYNENNPQPITD